MGRKAYGSEDPSYTQRRGLPVLSGYPIPSPCFCYEYQNKGVMSVDFGINVKTKDL